MLYDEQLTLLPAPTVEQTTRFAEHVATVHSWYKHLPFFPPGASFVVFPNVNAGRAMRADGDQFTFHDIENGDYFAHNSRLPTAEYVVRFGYWDYWVIDNPRVHDPQPGPWLYSHDGRQRELLADEHRRQGSCRLTAFLNPAPQMFRLRASELERETDTFLASVRAATGGYSLGRFLRTLAGRFVEDPVIARYRAWAEWFRGDASADCSESFIESEAERQRQLLLDTLHRVRATWMGK